VEKSFMGSNEPLFILDGMTVDQTSLSSVTILDFDRIEVFKGVEASAFGSRGANGAIVFYTKRSSILKHSSIELYIAGYQKAREFYIPPYQSRTYKTESLGIPKTICWKPNIILDQKGEAVIRLQKDSRKTTMLIEGLTNSGEIIYKRVQE